MTRVKVPEESTTRKRPNPRCTHLDMAGDSTIVVFKNVAWCEQCGEGRPEEPAPSDLNAAALRIFNDKHVPTPEEQEMAKQHADLYFEKSTNPICPLDPGPGGFRWCGLCKTYHAGARKT